MCVSLSRPTRIFCKPKPKNQPISYLEQQSQVGRRQYHTVSRGRSAESGRVGDATEESMPIVESFTDLSS